MRLTQEKQVIEALRSQGGYATLRRLNEIINFAAWKTRTPEASVRRIVQQSKYIFKIQPGLWALTERRGEILKMFQIENGDKQSDERFSHAYFQGLLVEIGKMRNSITYIPAQDKHHRFIDVELREVANLTEIPQFTYPTILRKARTIDVI